MLSKVVKKLEDGLLANAHVRELVKAGLAHGITYSSLVILVIFVYDMHIIVT